MASDKKQDEKVCYWCASSDVDGGFGLFTERPSEVKAFLKDGNVRSTGFRVCVYGQLYRDDSNTPSQYFEKIAANKLSDDCNSEKKNKTVYLWTDDFQEQFDNFRLFANREDLMAHAQKTAQQPATELVDCIRTHLASMTRLVESQDFVNVLAAWPDLSSACRDIVPSPQRCWAIPLDSKTWRFCQQLPNNAERVNL